MRKTAKENEEAVLTSRAIAKHDFLGRSLRRSQDWSTQYTKRREVDKYIDSNSDIFAKMQHRHPKSIIWNCH
jgi:hypothetical protein